MFYLIGIHSYSLTSYTKVANATASCHTLYSLKFRAFPVILFFYQNEVLQFYKIKLWKVHCFKNLIVAVVRNEIFSLPTDGTIYKLVVIRISINKIEMPCGTYTNKVAAIDKGLYNNVCEIWR